MARDANGFGWNHGGSKFDFDCMVSYLELVSTWDQLDGFVTEKQVF